MKKVLFLSALCALALCSCSKDNDENDGNSFGKAEIRFELTGPEYQGNPSSDILEYFSITVFGTDFEGRQITKDLCTGVHDTVIVCTKAPDVNNPVFATLGFSTEVKKQIPEGNYSADYSIRVAYAIYDSNGKELANSWISRTSSTGILSADELSRNVLNNHMNNRFELYYDEISGTMSYGLAWKQAGKM